MTVPTISVVICAYTEERLADLVAAITLAQAQSLPPQEVIVVIDHNDALQTKLHALVKDVTIIGNSSPKGLSGARNTGVAAAHGEIIAFLDDDAVATPEWLQLLAEPFANPDVLGVGGGVTPLWASETPQWFPGEFYWVVGCSYVGMPQSVATIRNPIGANMAIRRTVFDAVGGFRSEIGRVGTLPVGCEETELCIRARQHWPQGSFMYQPQAGVFHRVPDKRTQWNYFSSRCYAEGLSKAAVTQFVGSKDSLSSERSYTTRILPQGVFRNLREGVTSGDMAGFARAGAIVSGLIMTVAGYLVGSINQKIRVQA